jgi:hypothetical protein
MADRHDAAAFTSNEDIFFNEGMYDPHTPQGMGLIAHEVTHALQNRQFGSSSNLAPSHSSDAAEGEASRNASSLAGGGAMTVSHAPNAAVARITHEEMIAGVDSDASADPVPAPEQPPASAQTFATHPASTLPQTLSHTRRAVSSGVSIARLGTQLGGNEGLSDAINNTLGSSSRFGRGLDAAGAALNFTQGIQRGQSSPEAGVAAAANLQATRSIRPLMSTHPGVSLAEHGVLATNALLNLAGAPEPVTDVTSTAAGLMPQTLAANTVTQGARTGYNAVQAVAGNPEPLDRQTEELVTGQAGTVLQGIAMTGNVIGHGMVSLTNPRAQDLDVAMGYALDADPISRLTNWRRSNVPTPEEMARSSPRLARDPHPALHTTPNGHIAGTEPPIPESSSSTENRSVAPIASPPPPPYASWEQYHSAEAQRGSR